MCPTHQSGISSGVSGIPRYARVLIERSPNVFFSLCRVIGAGYKVLSAGFAFSGERITNSYQSKGALDHTLSLR